MVLLSGEKIVTDKTLFFLDEIQATPEVLAIHLASHFNADTLSMWCDTKKLTDGSLIDYELLSLPHYMVGQAQRLIRACLPQK